MGQRIIYVGTRPSKPRRPRELTAVEKWRAHLDANEPTSSPYDPSSSYEEGDVIEHSAFGLGLVTEVRSKRAFTAVFLGGERRLIMQHDGLSVAEPDPESAQSGSVAKGDDDRPARGARS